MPSKSLRGFAVLMSAAVSVVLACEEKFPKERESAAPQAPALPPIGIDARPTNPGCVAGAKPSVKNTLIDFEKVSPYQFDAPVEVVLHDGTLYVLELHGRVMRLSDDLQTASVVIDVGDKIVAGGEAGLLGIAFHPSFAQNGFVYLYYTAKNPTPAPADSVMQNAIVRYHSADGGLTLDLASEHTILSINDPYGNHNGGTIAFGNDGLLYLGTGDGGSGGDPENRAQNKDELLGKMLRIDVDAQDPYGIPPTNPFAAGGGRGEIYALGLRNPYRWRFDSVTNDLWVGDVGQGMREEIDKVVLGGNYGWNIREGKLCYPVTAQCDPAGLIDPIVEHDRDVANAITGGVVYRGAGVPLLTGKYIYGDFGHGTFFAIPIDDPAPAALRLDEGLPRLNPSAFAIDQAGEVIFTEYGSGELLRIVPGGKPVPEMPAALTATGCVDPSDPKKAPEGLFYYDVNIPQWADGATAQHWLSIPETAVIRGGPDGQLALPVGSVAMKTFSAEGRRLETQLLLHRPDDTWSAYSYVWNAEQTDATLAAPGTSTPITLPSGRVHVVQDPAQCVTCHVAGAGAVVPTIGLEAAQLDRDDVDYGGGRLGNPLATLEKLMMIDVPVPRDVYTPLPRGQGFQTAERRARAYLHANCAFCHRGGEANALDLRYRTPLRDARLCNVPAAAPGRVRLAPRAPQDSQLLSSMQALSAAEGRMPPVGSSLVDQDGAALVSAWISTIATCE